MNFNNVIQQWCPFFKLVILVFSLFPPKLIWPHLQAIASTNFLSIFEVFLVKRFCNQSGRQLWAIFLFVCLMKLISFCSLPICVPFCLQKFWQFSFWLFMIGLWYVTLKWMALCTSCTYFHTQELSMGAS